MSIFIKKKFIGDGEVDGAKILVLNNQAVRAENSSGSAVELFKLDSSDVLQFVQMPQVSADPSVGNHVARKSYVDAQDAAEAAARAAAVSDLEAAVDAEEARALAAEAALQSAVDAEEAARIAADSAESTARSEADAALQAAIDAEEAARTSADSALQGEIDAEEARALAAEATLQSAIDAEAAARAAEDSAINARIDNVLSNIDPEALDSLTEIVTAFQAADSSLEGTISSLAASASSDLAAEEQARIDADAVLQSAIDDEVSRATGAEANLQIAIDTEASERAAADSTLSGRLDSLEADSVTKTYVDSQDALKLDLAGGTMSGDINMDAQAVNFSPAGAMGQTVKVGTIDVAGPFGMTPAFGIDAGNNDVRVVTSYNFKVEMPTGMAVFDLDLSPAAAKINFPELMLGDGVNAIALKGVATPVSDTDGANKAYADSAAAAAASAEEARALAAEAALQGAIDQEIADRQAAVSAEETRALGAEAALQAAIDAEVARATQAEIDAQAAAEAYTDSEISALKGEVSGSYDTLKKIEDKIEFMVQNTDPAALDSLAEIVSAFQSADGDINTAISNLAASASADLDAEEAARIAADAAEASARQSADDALSGRLDVLEADPTTKTYVDEQIALEAAARIAGSAVLQASVDALEASLSAFQPAAPEVFTLTATDVANQYVELSVSAIVANSLEVRVNRMFALPSEFTQSAGTAGVVRLTFAGALASGGQQALVAGDTLVVRYWVE